MVKNNENQKPSNQTLSVEVEYGDDKIERIKINQTLWAKLEKAAQNHGNSIGEELAEIWNSEIG